MPSKKVLIKASVDPEMHEFLDALFRSNPEYPNITFAIREVLERGRRAIEADEAAAAAAADLTPPSSPPA